MTRSTTGVRSAGQWRTCQCTNRRASILSSASANRVRLPAAIDQNLPDGDRIGLCIAQDRQQASIRQLQAGIGDPLSVGGFEHHGRGTTCKQYRLYRRKRRPSRKERPFAIGAQVADPFGPSSTKCRGAEPSSMVDRQVTRASCDPQESRTVWRGDHRVCCRPLSARSGVGCRRPPRDPSLCTSPYRTPRHESVFRRRSRRTHPFRACLQSAAFRLCR